MYGVLQSDLHHLGDGITNWTFRTIDGDRQHHQHHHPLTRKRYSVCLSLSRFWRIAGIRVLQEKREEGHWPRCIRVAISREQRDLSEICWCQNDRKKSEIKFQFPKKKYFLDFSVNVKSKSLQLEVGHYFYLCHHFLKAYSSSPPYSSSRPSSPSSSPTSSSSS